MSQRSCSTGKLLRQYQRARQLMQARQLSQLSRLSLPAVAAVERGPFAADRVHGNGILRQTSAAIDVHKIFIRKNTQHRVILLPELPPETPEKNPLLRETKDGLPPIGLATEENCYYGLGRALLEFESAVCKMENSIEAGEKDWKKLLNELESARVRLESIWSCVNLLSICTDKLDMDRFTQLNRRAERAFLSRFDSKTIFEFINGQVDVSGEEKVILDRYRLEYRHQGYELPEKKYLELNANWIKRLSEAQRDLRFKISSATQRFRHMIRDPSIVREFPTDLLKAMAMDSSQPARGPWSVTLHPYIYRKFMEFCPDRKLRWNAYVAYISRGSRMPDVYLNASGHVKDIRQHRLDQAVTLGYNNYAEMSMATKMAGNVENVRTLISTMLPRARTAQEIELAQLQEYAETRGFDDAIREFDVDFFRRKEIRTLYGVDEESMREFFPLPHVLTNIFNICKQHFDLNFSLVQDKADGTAWTDGLSLYKVTDSNGQLKGHIYFDPYIRDDKGYQGGDRGWFIPIRPASKVTGSSPIGTIVMALSTPGYGKPSLLSFSEVEELLKLFGKAITQLSGARTWSETSDRMGMEWDALNFMPNLMANWLTQPDLILPFTSHWSTGEKLSAAQAENLVLASQHLAGYRTCHLLFKAAYDIAFYSEDFESEQYQDLAKRLSKQFLVLEREKEEAFPLYFEDILVGQWAAGYYSDLWSKMLAADVFSAYLEVGYDKENEIAKVSKRIKETFLEQGSSRPTATNFREFRGRDPNPEALMIALGLSESRIPKQRAAH